ncbi:threonine synthase [Inquilinus sp. CAU 1745]|uniref:threonine synthase n=1 Tax=Inquilinus sp. CAU 1745 TaxID=3140369 RepID=UPI00325BD6A8
MRYISTRGEAPALSFEDVLLAGLARDGGLYVPESWPAIGADDLRAMRGLTYPEIAVRVMTPFLGGAIPEADFRRIVADAYSGFEHPAIAPLVQLDERFWLMELFHGPTIAFKDYALQLVGRLFDHFLAKRGSRVTIVGATSGDTGSAAIEACRDREAMDIFILHPKGRVSDVQRRQMTTVPAANVHNIAIDGSFDDCQDLVKAMFNDPAFRDEMALSAVNSINWARIMTQIVYYVAGAVALGAPDRRIAFAVPTGNFGNIYAAYGARAMGLPVEKLIVGSNTNDILDRFFKTGEMAMTPVVPTISPSMDIQISSNFERLLFDLHDRDGKALAGQMRSFREARSFKVSAAQMERARALFDSHRLDDDGIRRTIAETHRETGQLIDPHTAVGLAAARACPADPDVAVVSLACAHPAKFPDAVEAASGIRPALPPKLADLFEREERLTALPNDLGTIQKHVRDAVARREAA